MRMHVLGRFLTNDSRTSRFLRRVAALAVFAFGLYATFHLTDTLAPEYYYRKDFVQDYMAARAFLDGLDPYGPTSELVARYIGPVAENVFPVPSPHPPTTILLILPFAGFSAQTAMAAWLLFELVCLAVSIYLLAASLGRRPSILVAAAGVVALAIFGPFKVELDSGQFGTPLLACLTGSLAALRFRRSGLAGVLVGLSLLLKPLVWPLGLLFLLRRDWRALIGTAGTVLGGFAVSTLVMGPRSLVTYVSIVMPIASADRHGYYHNISLFSFGWKLFSGTGSQLLVGPDARPLIAAPALAPIVAVALPGLILVSALAACYWLDSRRPRQPANGYRDIDLAFGLIVVISAIISPITWDHYLVLALIPVAQIATLLARSNFPSAETNASLVVVIALVVPTRIWANIALILIGRADLLSTKMTSNVEVPFALVLLPMVPALAVIALSLLVVWLAARPTTQPEQPPRALATGQSEQADSRRNLA